MSKKLKLLLIIALCGPALLMGSIGGTSILQAMPAIDTIGAALGN